MLRDLWLAVKVFVGSCAAFGGFACAFAPRDELPQALGLWMACVVFTYVVARSERRD